MAAKLLYNKPPLRTRVDHYKYVPHKVSPKYNGYTRKTVQRTTTSLTTATPYKHLRRKSEKSETMFLTIPKDNSQ